MRWSVPIIVRSSAHCWRTTSATRSPASTSRSSAPTRAPERLHAPRDAVRTVYASVMGTDAWVPAQARPGPLRRADGHHQVPRVSGDHHGGLFFRRRWPAARSASTSGTRTSIRTPACCASSSAWAPGPSSRRRLRELVTLDKPTRKVDAGDPRPAQPALRRRARPGDQLPADQAARAAARPRHQGRLGPLLVHRR